MTKAPTPEEMSKGQSDNLNKATKKFDYIAVADRPRTVSWSKYDHSIFLIEGYVMEGLISSLRKFHGRYGYLVKQYEVPSSDCLSIFLTDQRLN